MYAATGRPRGQYVHKAAITSRQLPDDFPLGSNAGIVFGREDNGLTNAELALADRRVHF